MITIITATIGIIMLVGVLTFLVVFKQLEDLSRELSYVSSKATNASDLTYEDILRPRNKIGRCWAIKQQSDGTFRIVDVTYNRVGESKYACEEMKTGILSLEDRKKVYDCLEPAVIMNDMCNLDIRVKKLEEKIKDDPVRTTRKR